MAMPTCSISSTARSCATARFTAWWSRTVSSIWLPIVCTGDSDVSGSWKIMAISLPRMSRITSPLASSPAMSTGALPSRRSNRIRPLTMRLVRRGSSRRTENAVTLLPHPDSPTTPSVSPGCTASDTPSTARTTPSRVVKCVRRPSMRRSGRSPPGVPAVTASAG